MIKNINKIIILIIVLVIIYLCQNNAKENFALSSNSFNYDINHTKWTINNDTLTIYTNSLPYHSYGRSTVKTKPAVKYFTYTFYNRGGTNVASSNPKSTSGPDGIVGYTLNGVRIMNAATGGRPPTASGTGGGKSIWPEVKINNKTLTYTAAYYLDAIVDVTIGQDLAGGHADMSGVYHYHDFSFMNVWKTGNGNYNNDNKTKIGAELSLIPYYNGSAIHDDGHSKILGFAFDGYPIYGPYGYKIATDSNSGIKPMTSGYTTKKNWRNATENGVQNVDWFYRNSDKKKNVLILGIFVEDWEFTNAGDLDEHNGIYCITPDYPQGTYAYFTCVDSKGITTFPHFVGSTFYGDVYDNKKYPKGSA